jgi:indolepyruvate ferredoxin oxidoreductase beta subunit
MSRKLDLYLTGVGGQGILTIADIIMIAAMEKGIHCNYFPTKGMAQRGGFVKAQLRLGQAEGGPDISLHAADTVISMELSESLKAVDYLKKDGDFLVYGYRWLPTEVMLGRAPYPDRETVMAQVRPVTENGFFLDPAQLPKGCSDNIFVLGAAMRHTELGKLFSREEILNAVIRRFPKAAEANTKAFEAGYEA